VSAVMNIILAIALFVTNADRIQANAKYEAEAKAHRETIRENDEFLAGLLIQMKENRAALHKIMYGEKK
jgi:hypothetical protein